MSEYKIIIKIKDVEGGNKEVDLKSDVDDHELLLYLMIEVAYQLRNRQYLKYLDRIKTNKT